MSYLVAPRTCWHRRQRIWRASARHLSAANAAAAAPTTAMLAACADEVSAVVASLFARHAQAYQALSLQATAFHQQFVQALTGAGGAYAAAEAVNAAVAQSVQQDVLNVINAPTQALFDR